MMLCEYIRDEEGPPRWALRWSVESYQVMCEVCSATIAIDTDGRTEDLVMSNGNVSEHMPLEGPWSAEFTIQVKFDGFGCMWAEDLSLGTVDDIDRLAHLLKSIYARAEQLMNQCREEEDRDAAAAREARKKAREECRAARRAARGGS